MKKILIFAILVLYGSLFIYSNINRKKTNNLYTSIVEYAEKYNSLAINASYHVVDKQVPGSNGSVVDVDASYDKMLEKGYYDESLMVYKTISPETGLDNIKREAIYHGNERKKEVTLNINVAWGEEYLPEMLEILDKYNVKANFFIEGNWASKNGEMVKLINEKGHDIGNHSYSHADFSKISREEMLEEIEKTNKVLESLINKEIVYFAPPSGAYNSTTIDVADELGMRTIMWSVDTIDWQKPSSNVIKKRVLDKVSNGSFILMHPTENTVNALEDIIVEISKKGLSIKNLDYILN